MSGRWSVQARGSWTIQEIVGATVLVGLGVAVTWSAWRDIFWIATRDEEQSHVLLVPLVAAWLVWVRRERLRRCPRDGRWIGPVVVAMSWLLYAGGDLLLLQASWHLGAIGIAVGCFLSFAGHRYLWRLLPAFLVLGFMVPVPGLIRQEIALPLQTVTADATQRALDVLGIEVVRTGNALSINGIQIAIAEACNGMRMAFALFLVSYAFAYGVPIREPVRIVIVLLSPLTAIACNVIRLVPTVWIYGFVSVEAGDLSHDLGGWIMLPIAFLLLLAVFRTLRWALVPVYRYTLAYGR